jgi:hypothetical protein
MSEKSFDDVVNPDHYPPIKAADVHYAPQHLKRRTEFDDTVLALVGIIAAVFVSALSVVAIIISLG